MKESGDPVKESGDLMKESGDPVKESGDPVKESDLVKDIDYYVDNIDIHHQNDGISNRDVDDLSLSVTDMDTDKHRQVRLPPISIFLLPLDDSLDSDSTDYAPEIEQYYNIRD